MQRCGPHDNDKWGSGILRWKSAGIHLYPPGADYRIRPQRIARPDLDWDGDSAMNIAKTQLSILTPGQQFLYVFDLGDDWTHLCTVADKLIDPLETLGITTSEMPGPLSYWGWGSMPDRTVGERATTAATKAQSPPTPTATTSHRGGRTGDPIINIRTAA